MQTTHLKLIVADSVMRKSVKEKLTARSLFLPATQELIPETSSRVGIIALLEKAAFGCCLVHTGLPQGVAAHV